MCFECVYVWKHISTQVCFLAIPSTDSVPMLLLGWTLNLLKGWVYFPCFEGRIYRFQLSHIHKSWPLLSAARSEPLEREKKTKCKTVRSSFRVCVCSFILQELVWKHLFLQATTAAGDTKVKEEQKPAWHKVILHQSPSHLSLKKCLYIVILWTILRLFFKNLITFVLLVWKRLGPRIGNISVVCF